MTIHRIRRCSSIAVHGAFDLSVRFRTPLVLTPESFELPLALEKRNLPEILAAQFEQIEGVELKGPTCPAIVFKLRKVGAPRLVDRNDYSVDQRETRCQRLKRGDDRTESRVRSYPVQV